MSIYRKRITNALHKLAVRLELVAYVAHRASLLKEFNALSYAAATQRLALSDITVTTVKGHAAALAAFEAAKVQAQANYDATVKAVRDNHAVVRGRVLISLSEVNKSIDGLKAELDEHDRRD